MVTIVRRWREAEVGDEEMEVSIVCICVCVCVRERDIISSTTLKSSCYCCSLAHSDIQ